MFSASPSTFNENEAVVLAAEPGFAWVRPGPADLCAACAGSGRCGAVALGRLFGESGQRFRVIDPLGVRPGERIVVGVAGGLLWRAAVWAYLLPLAGLLSGAVLGTGLWPAKPDAGGLSGATLGLILALGALRWRSRELALKHGFEPVVLRRLETNADGAPEPLSLCQVKQKDFQR